MNHWIQTTYRPFTDRKTGLYQYSSLQINVPSAIATQILEWGDKEILEKDIYSPSDDLVHGREDELHVTILYGIYSEIPAEIFSLLANQSSFKLELGQISIFENENFDVIKIEVISPELVYLNELLKKGIDHKAVYHNYKPHVTVAYTNKNLYRSVVGKSDFNGWYWMVNSIIFSSRNGDKTPLRLSTSQVVPYS